MRTARILLAAWISAACGAEPPQSGPTSVRDSAGIRIVENVGTADLSGTWSVSPEPLVRLGWRPGDPEFQSIRSGMVGPEGQIVVADAGSRLVHFLAADGSSLSTVGGEGEGPGEFRRVGNTLRLGGDSVLVVDGGNLRVNLYVGRKHDRAFHFENLFSDALYQPVGRSADGSFFLGPAAFAARDDVEAGWRSFPLLRTVDFATVDTVANFPMVHSSGPGSRNPIRNYGIVLDAGGAIAVAKTDEAQIVWLDPAGTLTQIARWDETSRPVTEADWPAFDVAMRDRLADSATPERLEEVMAEWRADFGGRTPLFAVAYGDRVGNVWLGKYWFLTTSASIYRVVSADGEWLGQVEFPRDIRILDITDDRVLGVEVNQLRVEALVVYELRKPGD